MGANMKFKVTKTLRLDVGTPAEKKQEIRQYFLDTIELEESLYSLLKNDLAFYQKPEPLRHPLVFYFGHTHTFYINKLYAGNFIKDRINPFYESMLAVGVDEMSWDDLNDKNYDWPSIGDLRTYRIKVKERVLDYIEQTPLQLPITWESPFWPIIMGIEHQRIHIETSSVLIRQLSLKHIQSQKLWEPCSLDSEVPTNQMLPLKGGPVKMGRSENHKADAYYGWDNEYGTHQTNLNDFLCSQFVVSNGEFKEFMDEGGYKNPQWWTQEGWDWKNFKNATMPTFWKLQQDPLISSTENDSDKFLLRTIDREIPLPLSWPAEVNYLEAKAFCNWKSHKTGKKLRLPTEDEWALLRESEKVPQPTEWSQAPGNINLEYGASSYPVNHFKFKNFYDVIGNVWQWTETPIYPFKGFKVHQLYDDFSVPTFDNRHNLIKGGSWISTGNEALKEARYAFRRHFFQHAGFRYVESANIIESNDNPYETDLLMSQYCEFHFGDEYYGVANFPKNCIDQAKKFFKHLPQQHKALDLGCSVGRSSFELTKYFDQVTGIDFSTRFIDKAQLLLNQGFIRYAVPKEGQILEYYERSLVEMGFSKEDLKSGHRLEFLQGDACNLSPKFKNYDLIFAGNLLDRLHSPKSFLHNIQRHLKLGGLLVLTSPYTWLEEYTPLTEWVGGYMRAGENLTTLQGLDEELSPWFERISDPLEIPFVIRETQRKFQHTVSEMTVWKKHKESEPKL
jgi:5-histidylcysteine sulfoxide synthase/putative 4-mercaptohistidine N1-methyltranferase